MYNYEIQITGEYDLLILSPEMIALLIEKTRNSDKRELHIPAEEILPKGYADYLIHVLEANMEILFLDASVLSDRNEKVVSQNTSTANRNHNKKRTDSVSLQKVYQITALQLKQLYIHQHACFDTVNLYESRHRTQFYLLTGEIFYMLAKAGNL